MTLILDAETDKDTDTERLNRPLSLSQEPHTGDLLTRPDHWDG